MKDLSRFVFLVCILAFLVFVGCSASNGLEGPIPADNGVIYGLTTGTPDTTPVDQPKTNDAPPVNENDATAAVGDFNSDGIEDLAVADSTIATNEAIKVVLGTANSDELAVTLEATQTQFIKSVNTFKDQNQDLLIVKVEDIDANGNEVTIEYLVKETAYYDSNIDLTISLKDYADKIL